MEKTAYAYAIIKTKYGGWTPAAVAERLGLKLLANGNFGGWLTVEGVEDLRSTGVDFELTKFKFA